MPEVHRIAIAPYLKKFTLTGQETVTALAVADTPQPPDYFSPPPEYSTLNLPPQMVQQLLGR